RASQKPAGRSSAYADRPPVGDVAPGNNVAAAVDSFLRHDFLVDSGLRRFLCPGGSEAERQDEDDDCKCAASPVAFPLISEDLTGRMTTIPPRTLNMPVLKHSQTVSRVVMSALAA